MLHTHTVFYTYTKADIPVLCMYVSVIQSSLYAVCSHIRTYSVILVFYIAAFIAVCVWLIMHASLILLSVDEAELHN